MSEGQALTIVLSVVFLAFSAFFSSSEAAFLSLQRTRLTHLVSTGVPGARRVESMVNQTERLLSTILLGNNLVNVAFTALVTVAIVSALGEGSGIVVATAIGTAALLFIGETIPKTIAVRHAERVAFAYAKPLKWVDRALLPLVLVLLWTTRRVNSLLGVRSITHSITEGELRSLIGIGEAEGTFEPAEAEMLENVFRFGDRQVRELMTPRTEIGSIDSKAVLKDFLDTYASYSHTRFPVYKDSVDNIIGIVSAKDILKAISTKGMSPDDPVTEEIRDAYFVPETKMIAELFDELRRSGNQMAIAIDEYGGLAGLVTLKQLSEEVVGPVGEEGAAPEEEYETIDENTFQVEGGMSIDEVNEELGVALRLGGFETLAGFVLDVLGHIPVEGEQFDHEGLRFEITQMDNLKIGMVKVTTVLIGSANESDTGQIRRHPSK